MRLFIAIKVPEALHKYCRELQQKFKGIKPADDFHITLQFLGEAEDPQSIIDKLSKIKLTPFRIMLGDPVPFPSPDKSYGIWIECLRSESLNKLAEKIRQHMSDLGYRADKLFKPHVTLGRYKNSRACPPMEGRWESKGKKRWLTVHHFELIHSIQTKGKHKYKTLATF